MPRFAVPLASLVLAALAALFFYGQGRPVPVPDGPAGTKVACVSYAPYDRHQTPFDPKLVIPPEQIERDMAVLSGFTGCVRTYATGQGLDRVPEIAARHGLTVYAGAWIGTKEAENHREIARLAAAANAHPRAIRGLIVGNEVLLRGEQTAASLAAYVAELRRGLKQPLPITYADVWEFWLRHPELANAVDFVTIHLLPYWEDRPTAIDGAIVHVMAAWKKTAETFPGKPILIGEVGWPSAGRRREGAEPGRVNQTRFVREFMTAAIKAGADYNLIEAFDQPWKRELEGSMGGSWGFFDTDRNPKVTLAGPVVEWPAAGTYAVVALGLGLLPLLWTLLRRRPLGWTGAATLALSGFAAAAVLALQWRHMAVSSRTWDEWAVNGGWLAFSAAMAWVAVRTLSGLRDPNRTCRCPWPEAWSCVCPLGSLMAMRFAAVIGMSVASLGLLFNARYRDFPVSMFLIPAAAFALIRLPAARREEKAVAVLLAASSAGVLVNEGILNTHAWLWAAVGILLAAETFIPDPLGEIRGTGR